MTIKSIAAAVDGSTSTFVRSDGTAATPAGGGSGGAPVGAGYVVLAPDGSLTHERTLTGSSTVSVTDAGAGSTVTLTVPDSSITTAKMGGDVTTAGKALLTAADAAAQKTALSLATVATSASAADITSGTLATARLGTGTANATTFLRGDQTWATPAGGSGASLEASIITATQANSTLTPAVLGTATFTIPAGKKAVISGNLIFTAAATTTGAFFGVTVTQPTGADGNATGSCVAYINITSAAAATGLNDGDVFNVAANATATVGTLSTGTTAGNNPATLCCVIHNRATNASTTVDVVFRSEVNTSAVTAQIGSGATCVISA